MTARNLPHRDIVLHRQTVLDAAASLLRAGAVSESKHGNISVRIPGTDLLVLTNGASLAGLWSERLAVLDLDGRLMDGFLEPVTHEIVPMHTQVYRAREDVGAIVHTHSPHATAFAVANRPLPCAYEPMARFGILGPVPVAPYGPRGSPQAVNNIVRTIGDGTMAVLLQNHGILALGVDAAHAVQVAIALEEGARMAILAASIGGAVPLSPEMAALARARPEEFQRTGIVAAPPPAEA